MAGDSIPAALLCLTGCAIPAPVVLNMDAPFQLHCSVNALNGEVQLHSSSKRRTSPQLHFRAVVRSIHVLENHLNTSMVSSETAQPMKTSIDLSTRVTEEDTSLEPGTPPPLQPSKAHRLGYMLRMTSPALAKKARPVRCSAEVTLGPQVLGNGWISHPAVADNALQLGPATGDVGKEDDADVTRVVAGLVAYVAAEQVQTVVPSACPVCVYRFLNF